MSPEAKFIALLMEQDSFFTEYALRTDFKKAFPDMEDEEYQSLFKSFEGDGSLIAFDLESDGLDGESFDHQTHGLIESRDLSLVTGTTYYYSLGSSLPVRLQEQRSAVLEAALEGGLSEAARLLSRLPIESSSWTGIRSDLTFDAAAKAKLVKLVQKARTELTASQVSNAQHSKADAYLECALLLAEQPEPDSDLIMELIRRALVVMGAVGLMADLKSLFWN